MKIKVRLSSVVDTLVKRQPFQTRKMALTELEELKNHFKTHTRVREVTAHSAKVHTVDWNCDGRRLASGSFDKTVCLFTVDSDRLVKEQTFSGHNDSVDQLCWHETNPDLLSTASGDKTMRVWDARIKKNIATVNTKGENINITWSPDGNSIAVGNKEDLVTFIDARTFKIRMENQFKFEVNEIEWNKASNLFFLTSGQGCIHILDYPELTTVHVTQAHPANCICIEFDPTGRYFATGSADALVSLWDADEIACLRTFSRLDWPVRTLSFSHDGSMLASGSEDLLIDVSHVGTGERVIAIPVDTPTFTVAWHPRSHLLAYACDDKDDGNRDAGTVKLFGLSNE
ncbi:THO complex subunit 3 [Daphnia magna]|uniref:THO complex subunit 3 n=3 Tax=Daphnia TaxID=6668 RepID=A0A0N8DET8_9CRUS|nr:THO complex subunit 3 [Daphnia magna]KZS14090.1 THO complex subunit 3 [Daphnia magna]